MYAIVNTKLILEDGICWDGAITWENDRIVAVGKRSEVDIPADAAVFDAGGKYTAPGFIDIHNHGSKEHLFAEEPAEAAAHFLEHGETTVLPTFYCNLNYAQLMEGARLVREASKTGAGRIMDGLYMEGPYMNGDGSNKKDILWNDLITPEEFIPIVDNLKDMVRVWAVDPARENIEQFMAYAKQQNPDVIFALGHSEASAADCRRVRKYGVKVQTHHGDSGKKAGLAQGTVGAGCDEYTLYEPDMYAELICDETGIHVEPDMIKMVVRTKGIEHIVLITDSMAMSGDYKNNEAAGIAWGPDLNYDSEGMLAGSHLTLDGACRNLMTHTGYGLCHAVRCATLNPARLLGLDGEIGSLAPGKRANLIVIDDMVHVSRVILNGETVIEK